MMMREKETQRARDDIFNCTAGNSAAAVLASSRRRASAQGRVNPSVAQAAPTHRIEVTSSETFALSTTHMKVGRKSSAPTCALDLSVFICKFSAPLMMRQHRKTQFSMACGVVCDRIGRSSAHARSTTIAFSLPAASPRCPAVRPSCASWRVRSMRAYLWAGAEGRREGGRG